MLNILIRDSTQTNIENLLCNKQPQLGCVTRAGCDPRYQVMPNKMDGNDSTNRIKTRKCKKYSKKRTLKNDLNYARVTMIP